MVSELWRVSYADEESYSGDYGHDNYQRRVSDPRVILQYTIFGQLDWFDENGQFQVPAQHFVLFTLDEKSRFARDPSAGSYRCRWISLAGSGIDSCWRGIYEHYGRIHGPDDGSLLRRIKKLGVGSSASAVHNFVHELQEWLELRYSPPISAVDRALQFIEEHPHSDKGVSEIAAEFKVSREHLNLCFAQRHGISPGQWLLHKRLAYARELLTLGSLGLKEIAIRCGMGNARRLSRALKRTQTNNL
ncbi:MAG: helix-turn-helix transcriptional regulator [Planctomycetes bacterium]|nr:helix-turn-helix transcriptional regulator [Planctomycetota bacterium]